MRRLADRARRWVREIRDRRRLVRSGIFDAAWYLSLQDERLGGDPALHFLREGVRRGLRPHPLFDTLWYRREYPDVDREGANPLLHYLVSGAREGRDPNPYFSSSYYLAAYPDVARENANPLAHYIAFGAKEGRRPSPRFDAAFYRRQLEGEELEAADLLAHFLTVGADLGLRPAPDLMIEDGEPVEWAAITVAKPWRSQGRREAALFVTHSPDGRIKPHVRHHLRALEAHGVGVLLIVAADRPLIEEPIDDLAGLYVRENVGFDFAAWAHVLKLSPELWDLEGLYLLNDSILGPVDAAAYGALLTRIRFSPADVAALTESREHAWHMQSYFLHLSGAALANARLQAFFNAVRTLSDKQAVIDRYELAFTGAALEAGLTVETLFRNETDRNPTLYAWRRLLEEGFPFLKVSVALGRHEDVANAGWREALGAKGFDTDLADALFARHVEPSAEAWPSEEPEPWRPQRIAFYGPWNYSNGLGEASRGYLSALWRLKRPLNLHGVKAPFHIHRRLGPGADVRDFFQAADAAIVHLNPDGWHFLSAEQRREISRARYRIGVWVWEMSHIPDFFRPNFEAVDAIWTPSRYCQAVFQSATPRPVHVIPHVVQVPPEGPSGGSRSILYVFDGSSYLSRKNPLALLDAFTASGLSARGWTLVLKTKNLSDHPDQAKDLLARCQSASGVILIDSPLTRQALTVLFQRADVYASPHASEGFGLTIAEAMAAGKIVVATDFGGSRDFLDETCGYPVPYRLHTLTRDDGHYQAGGQWADVDALALTEALKEAAGRVDVGDRRLGDRARARIAETLSAEAVARAMAESLERLAEGVREVLR